MESPPAGTEARSSENVEPIPELVSTNDNNLLLFLDSLDSYITLMDSLSSTLRQGWFQLAGARHSMGPSRFNPALLDLNVRPAATLLQLHQHEGEVNSIEVEKHPHFTLCSWVPSEKGKCSSMGEQPEEERSLSVLRHRGNSLLSAEEKALPEDRTSKIPDAHVKKERLKLLSMFGTLVPPNLRAAQLSFEKTLDTLVEIANMRSSILHAFDEAKKDIQVVQEL